MKRITTLALTITLALMAPTVQAYCINDGLDTTETRQQTTKTPSLLTPTPLALAKMPSRLTMSKFAGRWQ